MLEAKLALIHLLRRFTFIQAPDTEVGCCGVHAYNMLGYKIDFTAGTP